VVVVVGGGGGWWWWLAGCDGESLTKYMTSDTLQKKTQRHCARESSVKRVGRRVGQCNTPKVLALVQPCATPTPLKLASVICWHHSPLLP
jgi:hypothetical protein